MISSCSVNAADPLKPQFFVTRQNGTMVPLIAMDELPSTVSIREVPRMLSPHNIHGMTGIGTFNTRHRQYVVDGINRGFPPPDRVFPDKSLMASSYATPDTHQARDEVASLGLRRGNGSPFPSLPKAYGIHEQQASTASPSPLPRVIQPPADRFAAHPRTPLPLSSATSIPDDLPIRHAPGVKEYCSYWLRHGECDYAQQGCLYRHEMPLDRGTLEKLGLRDIPRWYREKHGLGSYLAGGSTMSGFTTSSSSSSSKPAFMDSRNWRSHPAEVLPQGTGRKPENEREEVLAPPAPTNTPIPEHRGVGASGSTVRYGLPTPPTTPTKPTTTTAPMESKHASKPTSSIPIRSKRDILGSRLVPANTETAAQRQIRETVKALDAYEERERKILAERYRALVPQMPSTRTSSSSASDEPRARGTGAGAGAGAGARAGRAAEHVAIVMERVEGPSGQTVSSDGAAAAADGAKKRATRSRRKVSRDEAGLAGRKGTIRVGRLVDHE